MEQLIRNGLEAMDLLPQTPDRAPAQLAEYGRLLLEKNQVMNLTAITEPERVAQLHMLDSAALLKGRTSRTRPSSTWAPEPAFPAFL